jgi:hypothetical protein
MFNFFKQSNLGACLFMAPDRKIEKENEVIVSDKLHWATPPKKTDISLKLSKYNMNVVTGHNRAPELNLHQTLGPPSPKKKKIDVDIPIPYLHIKRKIAKGTIILFHANAEDMFVLERAIANDMSWFLLCCVF